MPYATESFGISDLGLVRENNEDVFHEIPRHGFFVLADGMGGHKAGETAAKEVVHHLSTSVCQTFSTASPPHSFLPISQMLHGAILQANKWVHQLSQQKEDLHGMGTTLCCVLLHQDSLIYAHVGDSRIYRFRDNLVKITEDHSLTPEEKNHMITRAIGTNSHVEPDVNITAIEKNDIYFLCSDGLTDFVPDEEISSILKKHTCIKSAAKRMIEAAKMRGGRDNITILMIRVVENEKDLPR